MFHEKVVAYCTENGISVGEFERRCGLSNGAAGKWKTAAPRLDTVMKIMKATDTDIGFWVSDPEEEYEAGPDGG